MKIRYEIKVYHVAKFFELVLSHLEIEQYRGILQAEIVVLLTMYFYGKFLLLLYILIFGQRIAYNGDRINFDPH